MECFTKNGAFLSLFFQNAFEDEGDDTKKQITDLQYDLLELRDAHAKLRTTNEKLKREKEKSEREKDDYRNLVSAFLAIRNQLHVSSFREPAINLELLLPLFR